MKEERILSAFGQIDESYIKEADPMNKTKKKNPWLKLGTMAACFCLVAVGAFMLLDPSTPNELQPGEGEPDVGGTSYSVAVYPASEDAEDIAEATLENISEADAYGMETLGSYLPTQLPAGYSFEKASLYETTMKNGTKYYMLRVFYTNGDIQASSKVNEDGDELAADPNTSGNEFSISVLNYQPNTERKIYNPEEITESILESIGGQIFYLSYGDIYVGISAETSLAKDIASVMEFVQPYNTTTGSGEPVRGGAVSDMPYVEYGNSVEAEQTQAARNSDEN